VPEDRKPDKDAPKPPTAGEIWALYRAKETDGNEGRLRRLAALMRSLVRMEHAIEIPDQYKATTKEVRTPFVRDAWQRTTAALTQNDWTVHIEPKGESQAAKRATGIAERWIKAAAAKMDDEVDEEVEYEAVKALVRDGESVVKVVDRRDAWANFPKRAGEDADDYSRKAEAYKKGSPIPFAWRCVDRLQCIFGDGEFGDDWVIEFGEYAKPFLKGRYKMVDDPTSGRLTNPKATLEGKPVPEGYVVSSTGVSIKLEYFDCYWWCVVVDGEMAPDYPKPNPYAPKLPYFRAKPDSDSEPALYSLLFLVPALDAILTAWTNWMWLGLFATPLLEDVPNSQALPAGLRPPTGDDAQSAAFEWKMGKMLEVPRGKRFSFMQPPPVGGDAKEMSLILRGLIDIAGIPSILRGSNLQGDSGYLANQMIGAAMMLLKRLMRAHQRQLKKAAEFQLWLVANTIKQTVYIPGQGEKGRGYLGVRPDGASTEWIACIDDLGEMRVERRPDMSVMKQAQAMIARQLTEGPPDQRLSSRRRAMEEEMSYEDPDTIIDEIWVEDQIANNPTINQQVVDNALREAGLWVPPKENPATQLVGPDGITPLAPPGLPGLLQGGLPTVPGLNMPMQPPPPQGAGAALPGGHPGGGVFPGLPGTPVQGG
jgi:hypothetical protein